MYHLYHNGIQSGPFNATQLRSMLEVGLINRDDAVWKEGMARHLTVEALLYQQKQAGRKRSSRSQVTAEPATKSRNQGSPSRLQGLMSMLKNSFRSGSSARTGDHG